MHLSKLRRRHSTQRGSSLFLVAASMVALLGLMGLCIDLVYLYVGKSEAQRAADAAALAGAQTFVTSGFTSGLVTQAVVQTMATNEAVAVGQKNLVGGGTPSIPSGNVTFDFTHPGNPLVTVTANATLNTFFMKIFGVTTASISAVATAEAYNAAGTVTGPTICASCLKPFLVPNCDPDHLVAAGGNPNCPQIGGQFQDYFLDPNNNYSIKHPGAVASGGIVGEAWTLHSGAAPSQWYAIAFLGAQSKSQWQADIASCNTDAIVCGQVLQTLNGKAVGPADFGIEGLINASGQGLGQGQDTIDVAGGTLPYPMYAGSNNPLVVAGLIAAGAQIGQSSSQVTLPVYDGTDTNGVTPLAPGGSQVVVTGYLQMFIQDVTHSATTDNIDAIILNVSSCGAQKGGVCGNGNNQGAGGGGSGTPGTVTGGGIGFLPVRLVHP